jgi:hypothetical protein
MTVFPSRSSQPDQNLGTVDASLASREFQPCAACAVDKRRDCRRARTDEIIGSINVAG